MKNTIKYIIAAATIIAAALSFNVTVFADEPLKVGYDKKVSGPDQNGVYTISLEAFVKGSITVESHPLPADIVLVLDYSSSMNNNMSGSSVGNSQSQNRRINLLRSAVKDFVDIVKTSNSNIEAKDRDNLGKGGHRIAFVLYSGMVYEPGIEVGHKNNWGGWDGTHITVPSNLSLNTFLDVEDLETTAASGSGNSYIAAKVKYSGDTNADGLLSPGVSTGTYSGDGMEKAESILDGVTYTNPTTGGRSRIVVFFTDGEPGYGTSSWTSGARKDQADKCIKQSYLIKNDDNHFATVYSVGLFNKPTTPNEITTYMSYTSSDYDDKQEMPTSGWVNVTGDKSIIVSSAGELANAFSSIGTASGGSYSAASASSVIVDVVASSFAIPLDADLGSIKVYKVPCTQQSATSMISFAEDEDDWEDITDDVDLITPEDEDAKENEVSVSGFDYGANWCGWDAENNTVHGNKLVLQIPITVKEDAIGGPVVETNETGSQLILRKEDGTEIASYDFVSPTVSIPVNIWIKKKGLVGEDSAVFTIAYATFDPDTKPEDIPSTAWKNFTKITVNSDSPIDPEDNCPVEKLTGLDPNYYYRIKEDAWAWSYTYQYGKTQYTVGEGGSNPFIFVNVPKDDVKESEATIRNVFKKKEKQSSTSTDTK